MIKWISFLLFLCYTISINAQIGIDDLTDAINDGSTIAIGDNSGINDDGNNANVFLGINAAQNNTEGHNNVAIGYESFLFNKTGEGNTAIGMHSLFNNTIGLYNTAIGKGALEANTKGNTNTAIGLSALINNTTGSLNAAIGGNSLYFNTVGQSNLAAGNAALYNNTVGSYNSATGGLALFYNTKGSSNTAQGYQALYLNISGNYNTAMGHSANSTGGGWSNTTGLGYNADCTANNQIRIGNAAVMSIGGFTNWTNVSDGRFKKNVAEDIKGLAFINALRPVSYQLDLAAINKWWMANYGENDPTLIDPQNEKATIIHSGFIAQEVEKAAEENDYSFSGVDAPKNEMDFYGLRYAEFVVPLVKSVQELTQLNEQLEEKINTIEAQNKWLIEQVLELKSSQKIAY